MRYILETTDLGNEKAIWTQILSYEKEGLIKIIEKGDPLEDMKQNLRRVARSIELLEKIGIDTELMIAYIKRKNPSLSVVSIKQTLETENEFFKKLGVNLGR